MPPRYRYPFPIVPEVVRDLLLVRKRSFRDDAIACTQKIQPPLQVLRSEYIPSRGPCLLTVNHYYRPGFRAWWIALGITAVLPLEPHWVMTNELTFPGRWYAPIGRLLTRLLLARAARVYGFTGMPPMPPRRKDTAARAHSVRAVLSFVDSTPAPVLCLAPEGGDMPGGRLSWPPLGAGRFVQQLAKRGMALVPVAAYEQGGQFCLHFGQSYDLALPSGLSSGQRDREAAGIVMGRIARLLPPHLRGDFAGE